MRPLHAIRNHPVALAAVLGVAFAAWLAYDAIPTPPSPPLIDVEKPSSLHVSARRLLPEDPTSAASPSRQASPNVVVTADLLPRLLPGMPRVEVEEILGTPMADRVHPVSHSDGRLTYLTTYVAYLGSAPLKGKERTSMIDIEYDAGRPGHPLVKVHLPDPMS